MNTSKIPRNIYPDNILHTIAQIRFESNMPEEARFGSVYKDIQSDYPEHTKLDIANIPADILKNDEALSFAPLHVFEHDNITIEFGFKCLSIVILEPYIGWDEYRKHINKLIDILKKLDISKITRIGLFYASFYEDKNMLDNINIDINNPIEDTNQFQYVSMVENINFKTRVEIRNDASINGKNGFLINLDTFQENDTNIENIENVFEQAHKHHKELFFTKLLTQDYINSLEREY